MNFTEVTLLEFKCQITIINAQYIHIINIYTCVFDLTFKTLKARVAYSKGGPIQFSCVSPFLPLRVMLNSSHCGRERQLN